MTTARDANVLVLPTGANADNVVRASVKGLFNGRGMTADEVADGIGMPRSTFYKRMAGHGKQQAFSGGEVAALATFFAVSTDYLYTGMAGAFWTPPTGPGIGGVTGGKLRSTSSTLQSHKLAALHRKSTVTRMIPAARQEWQAA